MQLFLAVSTLLTLQCQAFIAKTPYISNNAKILNGFLHKESKELRHQCNLHKKFSKDTTSLNAIIYWDEGDDTIVNEKEEQLKELSEIIMENIKSDRNRVSSLAKLAVAFSPPERRINIQDILEISVLSVGGNQIEIVAAVKHQEACATLLVPVAFPKSCEENTKMEECILDNLDILDNEADVKIRKDSVADEIFELAHNFEHSDLPSWWVVANDHSLNEECSSIRHLLNEAEFQENVKSLALRALENSGLLYTASVSMQRVIVTDVGPAGMNFCALVLDRNNGLSEEVTMSIPYAFTSRAGDAQNLRALVLGALAEATI